MDPETGIGFHTSELKPKSSNELDFFSLYSLKEDFYDWENEATGDAGIYGMIADVMSKETGIIFEYRNSQDEDEDDAIILPQMYPWQMNNKEKHLSQEDIENICTKYIEDLGNQLHSDFIRLEYFG